MKLNNKDILVEYVKKMKNYYNYNGFSATAKRIYYRLKPDFFIYRETIMGEYYIVPNQTNNNSLNFIIASEKDIDEEYKDIWHTKEQALERLRKGHILFLVKDKDSGANMCYLWVELSDISIPWLGIKKMYIPPTIAYYSGAYVPSQYRGQRLAYQCGQYRTYYLSKNKIATKAFSVTSTDNIASNRTANLTGRKHYQHVKYIKVFCLKIYIVESLKEDMKRKKKIFINDSNFWNVFSTILKET
ncbi:MAG: hypothetical protein SVZ03_02485 [Spirochaetota bacterium]|nr:hypothetical protein [Spirochaetota bacterium]